MNIICSKKGRNCYRKSTTKQASLKIFNNDKIYRI